MKESTKPVKKVGRPPVNLDDYFAKIQPYLQLGFSTHKACVLANIPYRTVMDYYNDDESFRNKIDGERENMVVTSRAKLKQAVDTKKRFDKEHELVLREMDEDFGKKNIKGIEAKSDGDSITVRIIDYEG